MTTKLINEIYEYAKNSKFDEIELPNGRILSLINLRDTAIDGGYENDEEAYKTMIQSELELIEELN